MIKNSDDPKEKIALLEQALGNIVGTFYIQTLFANYEYQAHKLVEEGKAVTPDVLSGIMNNLFKQYFGETLTMDELQKIVWARIPHFYNSPYYVYQYATSFASSANLYDRITNEKYKIEERGAATSAYLELLKSGGNDHPMNQLKILIIRDRDYNVASRCIGTPTVRIVLRNLLPYLVSVIMLRMALTIPEAIGNEVFITYIGLGLSVETPSLGNLVNDGRKVMMQAGLRYQLLYPTLILSFVTIAFYLIGNAFSDAADPKNHLQ